MHSTHQHTLGHDYVYRALFRLREIEISFVLLLSEIGRRGRRRWLQVDEMPFSRAITYKLIDAGLISSVVVTWPGSRRGRRLIDGDSLDSYLENLTSKQALPR